MRLLLLFASAFALGSSGPTHLVSSRVLPNGLPVGSVTTLFFEHSGKDWVTINFYNRAAVEANGVNDIVAHISLRPENRHNAVHTASYVNRQWVGGDDNEHMMDNDIIESGFWRVDFLRLDTYRAAVFFQGFSVGTRTFKLSLDTIESVYILGHSVYHKTSQIRFKFPNANMPPMNFDWYSGIGFGPISYMKFSSFPIGSHIEMTTYLRSIGGEKHRLARVVLTPQLGSSLSAVEIVAGNVEGTDRQRLALKSTRSDVTLCVDEQHAPFGELQHMKLERISYDTVTLRVFYNKYRGTKGTLCEFRVANPKFLDGPLELAGVDGGFPIHVEHSITRDIKLNLNE